ncbi:inner membrane CreD family protein [Verrucomicrobiaceae bacterium N1E253]|uniref:Inner membrane CreD family protein n=1 Tax=Oceaniferula marina TaxID=2748318 RepID=A0A851G994_9BACT|nr:inner membrane CreD family protein [Oceaniferula marina]NWK53996.1 inner membrane CreD family protein [Oceaniferula marina]
MTTNSKRLSIANLVCIGAIAAAVSLAWIILGGTLSKRNNSANRHSRTSVNQVWGPAQNQEHLKLWYSTEDNVHHRIASQPDASEIDVQLNYEPKKKGLSWNRTYRVHFRANYTIHNASNTKRRYEFTFPLPSLDSSYHDFTLKLDDQDFSDTAPQNGGIHHSLNLLAGESRVISIAYACRGTDQWKYLFHDVERIHQFKLAMLTNFADIDFQDDASSPTDRHYDHDKSTWNLVWDYPDVINPKDIGMDMPAAKNPGAVAAKISFYAPLSLLCFFAVLILFGLLRGHNLHPVNYLFLSAGFFAFHLLFAYLTDLIHMHLAFAIASAVSLTLIGGYLRAASGKTLMGVALIAQFFYLTLFSYSFLFKGGTGLSITLGSIATLALLMAATAKINWSEVFEHMTKPGQGTSPTPPSNSHLTQQAESSPT